MRVIDDTLINGIVDQVTVLGPATITQVQQIEHMAGFSLQLIVTNAATLDLDVFLEYSNDGENFTTQTTGEFDNISANGSYSANKNDIYYKYFRVRAVAVAGSATISIKMYAKGF